ncbi:MAG: type II secretion system F family protein, partial [candidate division WOR-3 bacterium]
MPDYLWKGRTPSGNIENGEITAENPAEVQRILRERKIVPTSIRSKPREITLPFLKGRISNKAITVFTRQFSVMINAGLPLIKCLDIQVAQVESDRFKGILKDLISSVEGGSTLADALREHKDIFGDLYVNMVEAGEKGGSLATILARLADYLESSDAIKRKVKGAMIYPAAIAIVAVIAVAVMLVFVIPVFASMFTELGGQVPLPTRIVMALSDFLRKWFFVIVGIILGLIIFIRYYGKTEV